MISVGLMPIARIRKRYGCWCGAKHDTGNLRGMLAIRMGFLMSTINALEALTGG